MAFGSISVDRIVDSEGSVFSPSSVSFRNRIINGDMRIDQRNAGASVTPANGAYTLDRWFYNSSQASKFTVQQNAGSVTPPTGFINYLGCTVVSSVSVGSTDFFAPAQNIEGFNIADLAWGTANAKTVTLSFWVRSSLTGTFGGALQNTGSTRSYPFTYTISVANTWEYKTVTIAGDTSGTWLTNNGAGLAPYFGLGVGTTYSGTAGAWAGTNYLSATGAVSVVGTNGATWYITGVQLEVGSVATPFERRPYGTELSLCQRYAYKLGAISLAKMRELDRSRVGFYVLPVEMRAAVTVPSISTTDAISVTIGNQTTRGFTMYCLATSDGMGADITSQAVVTAEL